MKIFSVFLLLSTLVFGEQYSEGVSADFVFKADLNRRLSHFIPYRTGENPIGLLTIDTVDQSTYVYVRRALKEFREKRVSFVLAEINAHGGEFFSALNIAKQLEEMDRKYDVTVIAFIHPEALGSAAIVPYSCRFIGIVQGGSIGAKKGERILLSEDAGTILAEMAASFGRDPLVAEAMVDPTLFLVLRGGETFNLPEGEEPQAADIVLSKRGERLTLSSAQMMNLGIADFAVPEHEGVERLALKEPFLERIPNQVILEPGRFWSYFFAFWLHPIFSALLFFIFALGTLLTFTSLRFRTITFWAIVSFLLILIASFNAYTVNWYEFAIFFIGLSLLAVEFIFLAGFGLTGIIGTFLTVVGIFALFMPELQVIDFTDKEALLISIFPVAWRFFLLLAALALAVFITIYLCKKNPEYNMIREKWIDRSEKAGFVKKMAPGELPPIGSRAIVLRSLRPRGEIRYEMQVFQAICEGVFVDFGQPVEVIGHKDNLAVVKEIVLK